MKVRFCRFTTLLCTGMMFLLLPGCAEVWILNLATPFLLAN